MTVCVVHRDHEAEEGWLVCRRAWGRLAGSLRQIPWRCDELEDRGYGQWDARDRRECLDPDGGFKPADPVAHIVPAGPTRPNWSQSRIRSSRPERLVIAVDPTDLMMPARAGSVGVRTRGEWSRVPDGDPDQVGHLSVATVLDWWVRDWSNIRGERPPDLRSARERSPVSVLCGWLLDRLNWACRHHPALDEFSADVQKLSGALYGMAGHGAARPKLMEAPCPDCRLVTLTHPYPDAYIECSMPDCGRILTPDEYEEMVREMRHEIRAQDVLTVLNGLESIDLEALCFAVVTATKCDDYELGEVMVLRSRKEVLGHRRRPGKDAVIWQEFKTLDEALAHRSEVLKTAEDVTTLIEENTP